MGNTDSKFDVPDTNLAGEQFCGPCISMFGTVKGLKALSSKKGYRYHSRNATEAGARNSCPLCKIIDPLWGFMLGGRVVQTDPDEDCILRAVCGQNSPRAIRREVNGYPLNILSIGFVFGTVGTDEKFLSLYQVPGDPASRFLTGCLTPSNEMFGEQSIQEVRRRLENCDLGHTSCPKQKAHQLPTTVLDLFPPDPKVYMTAPGEQGEYIALSYCWGGPQVMTTKDTLQANMIGIALHTLSQTVQDAISITRKLGIRYLWVDALCIVQDDETSKNKEIGRMGKIYSNATFTISAASAAHATDGFLRRPTTSNGCELPFLLPDGNFGKVLVVPSQETKQSVLKKLVEIREYPIDYRHWRQQEQWANSFTVSSRDKKAKPTRPGEPWPPDTRSWAFQEHMLSTRLLIFSPDDVRWRCQETQMEPLFPNPIRYRGPANRVPLLHSSSLGHNPNYWTEVLGIRGMWATTTRQRQLWQTVMTDFSNRSITVEQDRLPALAGIASQLEELWGGQYVAGYWLSCLPELLPWVRKSASQGNPYPEDEPEELKEYLAPSWSWIAARRPILLQPITDVAVEVISVVAEPLFPDVRYGRLRSANLTLSASLLPKDERFMPTWDQKMDHGAKVRDGMLLMKLGMNMSPNTKMIVGLILQQGEKERYRRVGLFTTNNLEIWQHAPRNTITII